ncbi:MAG: hypothetical protein MUF63_08890 [Rhodobacteraceae bacterium]|jgi:hypothetical protein|nr:hypothetical protein [Paracoccaceae bacterium]
MTDIALGPWKGGMDNVSPEASRDAATLADAENVLFDRDGGADRRAGFTLLDGAHGWSSVWTSPKYRTSYCAHEGWLTRLRFGGSLMTTHLYRLSSTERLSFCDLLGGVACSNGTDLLYINALDNVSPLAMQKPGAPILNATADGGLYAGAYAVAIVALRGAEEGPASRPAFVEVPGGGGIEVIMPEGGDTFAVYRSSANGQDMLRAGIGFGSSVCRLGAGSRLGASCVSLHKDAMRPGSILRHWRGRLFSAKGKTLRWSEPMYYGITDPAHNFVQKARPIVMVEPVEGGMFIGDEAGVVFMAGQDPASWNIASSSSRPPIRGASASLDGRLLSGDLSTDKAVAVWMTEAGFVLGMPDGTIKEVQSKKIVAPSGQQGMIVVRDNTLIALYS